MLRSSLIALTLTLFVGFSPLEGQSKKKKPPLKRTGGGPVAFVVTCDDAFKGKSFPIIVATGADISGAVHTCHSFGGTVGGVEPLFKRPPKRKTPPKKKHP